jgi:hypothetical protein
MMRTWGIIASTVAVFILFGGGAVSLADVPPPPANQFLGIFDGTFNDLTQSECRACHSSGLPDQHHLLVGTPIPMGYCVDNPTFVCQTDAECQSLPNPGAANDYCIADSPAPNAPPPPSGNYECLTCHTLVYDPQTMTYDFAPFRDCTLCHTVEYQPDYPDRPQEPTVHHRESVEAIQTLECGFCHGALVNNVFDNHYIPTYDPSLVTPWTSGKPNGGEPPNSRGTMAGNCNYCHDSSFPGDVGPILINHDTHHGTGLTGLSLPDGPWGPAGSRGCLLCHPGFGPGGDALDIRYCERCHGVQSLHNIEFDSDGSGIDPGNELAYYGHIGNQDDCWGCHGFASAASLAPYSGPVVPYVLDADTSVMTAGSGGAVTLSGAAFTNFVQTPEGPIELQSTGLLTSPDGTETSLAPQSVTEDEMVVNVPATLTAGKHYLRAAKATNVSNPAVIAVKPKVTIAAASCNDGTVTVTGSGFSSYVNATDSGTGVTSSIGGGAEKGTVVSWTDSQIVAAFSECGDTVEVSSVFGSAATSLNPATVCTPASVVGAGTKPTSRAASCLYLLLAPFATVVLWKIRRRGE